MSPDLNKALDYFFDMQDASLLDASNSIIPPLPTDIDKFLKVAEKIISSYLNLKIRVRKPILNNLRQESIIHGVCGIGSDLQPLTIIFARDIKIGIGALFHKGNMELWRITLSEQPILYQ